VIYHQIIEGDLFELFDLSKNLKESRQSFLDHRSLDFVSFDFMHLLSLCCCLQYHSFYAVLNARFYEYFHVMSNAS
jgi:hypothetical protein